MKIAFLNIYQDRVQRGAETFVKEVLERFKKDNEVDVITYFQKPSPRWPFLWRLFIDPNGIKVAWFSLKAIPKIWKDKYDIVIPVNGGWQPAFVRLVTWLYGGKMVVSGQSGMGWDDRNNLWSFPNAFVALSRKALSWAKRANPFVKCVYIPNGVDLTSFKEKGEVYKTSLEKPIVLCVGALTKQKRVDRVIKAVSKLGDVSLLVVGDGEKKEELQKLGDKLLGERFELTSVKYDKMPCVYRAGDVFTLTPFKSEAFGIVFVEAMATNLPVVTVKDEQRGEIVGDGGILVDSEDEKKYAEAIKEALSKKWGDKPRKQAEKFSWDEIAKKYEKLFKELWKKG